ncbi:hypothetical protein QBC43DRAFT_306494 [Cladorrhinum sp. PSN259]|nr:hypothetical protein QBC43DRAFT_306494 [Cladorrhinum sp. PSN259]
MTNTMSRKRLSRPKHYPPPADDSDLDTGDERQEKPPTKWSKNLGDAFLTEVTKDSSKLIKAGMYLLAGLYPIWKWLLIGYILWLSFSSLAVRVTTAVTKSISQTICPIPFLGPAIPLCAATLKATRPIDASKVLTSQEELSRVMDTVGRNFDLARDMVGHEFAVRDLRIRVAASTLPRRDELSRELASLVRQTKEAARGLSRFTAKVSKSVDMAKTFDQHAIKALEGIAKQQQSSLALILPKWALSVIHGGDTEQQAKDVFILTATQIGDKVRFLIEESFHLSSSLDAIHETLDSIKEIAVGELGGLPLNNNVLSELWSLLARPDDHARLKSHEKLLVDMTHFYKDSSSVMEKTTVALNQIDADLGGFRDDFATPELVLQDYPLEIIISMLRLSAERLEAGNLNLRRIEEGGRSRTITATVVPVY